jgi:16S rRNA (guanine527-N7)-methyltransferase
MQAEALAALLGSHFESLNRYVDLLADEGISWGLIGPNEDRDRLWERHLLNSLAIEPLLPDGVSVVDVGSGAGLPGIPLALARPDLSITLLEPMLRRTRFLEMAVERLGLGDRVQVVRARAEEHSERYQVVTCRALAALPKLLSWCWPLAAPSGRIIALKGQSAAAELEAAGPTLRKLHLAAEVLELAVPGTDEHTWAVVAS